ncbi:hypothetical protein L6Q21_10750 [Sandaracinobacter sp. RS1-74]|uniref:DUF7007 domain-containing protein n=1 Tax=Sandaracinobacteroides sayramensis TaxID=2913411 RepID=UPI001EDA3988|nr:hypothetical protein [Sandaracinobacteroides sayramensis]MCG2841459.1 hypothetical protein [Sandaracinobacteroides sayramensis]
MNAGDAIAAVFGRSADGHLAARVEDIGFIAIPAKNGFRVATGWRLTRPIDQWTTSNVFGASASVADEATFRAHVEENAEHRRQLRTLGRREDRQRISTPWGMAQSSEIYADGVAFHSTASHGGIKLDRTRNAAMPTVLRVSGGWYEEDCEWAKVAIGFPDLFTDCERRHADRTLRDYYPECWEAVHGRTLESGESFANDRRLFHEAHAHDWVVISAITSKERPGFVDCVATLGGGRAATTRRRFLVPEDEYRAGPHGFVIDEQRHRAWDGSTASAA